MPGWAIFGRVIAAMAIGAVAIIAVQALLIAVGLGDKTGAQFAAGMLTQGVVWSPLSKWAWP